MSDTASKQQDEQQSSNQNAEDIPMAQPNLVGTPDSADDDLNEVANDESNDIGSKGGSKSVDMDNYGSYAGNLANERTNNLNGIPDLGIDDPYGDKGAADSVRYNINQEWGSYGGDETDEDLDD